MKKQGPHLGSRHAAAQLHVAIGCLKPIKQLIRGTVFLHMYSTVHQISYNSSEIGLFSAACKIPIFTHIGFTLIVYFKRQSHKILDLRFILQIQASRCDSSFLGSKLVAYNTVCAGLLSLKRQCHINKCRFFLSTTYGLC